MTFRYADRVRVNCTPSGTGDIPIGTTPLGYQSFSDRGFVDTDTSVACIVVPVTGEFEICHITYNSAGPSITRGDILSSSNSDARVSFGGAQAGVIFVGLSADHAIHRDMTAAEFFSAGIMPVQDAATVTATGTVQGDALVITNAHAYITGGAADTGVKFRAAASDPIGTERVISNKTASAKIVYPDSSSFIDSELVNVGVSLAANQSMRFKRTGATQWYTS